jgi:phenol 2-monooxygenase
MKRCFALTLRTVLICFDQRGIDRARGALLLVRPDQFVAKVMPLTDVDGAAAFFDGFMVAVR